MWVFSDTAYAHFGEEVPSAILADLASTKLMDKIGGVLHRAAADDVADWTSVELVKRTELGRWILSKRTGAGRDPRLSALPRTEAGAPTPLLRTILEKCGQPQTPDPAVFGASPSAASELLKAVLRSGCEIPHFLSNFVTTSGAGANSSSVAELTNAGWTIHYFITVDLLDPYQSAAIEHLCRSILRLMRAIRRSPKNPDFAGLDGYMKHLAESKGTVFTPLFDSHIAAQNRDEAQYLKQNRLAREEDEQETGRRRKNNGKDNNKEKGKKTGEE
jgi:hypothetical protein